MAFGKILGIVTDVLPAESGNKQNGGVWTRQQFIVKKIEESDYEHFVALTLSGERIQKIAPRVGMVAWFIYDVESNKSNEGRWFTTATCIRCEAVDIPQAVAPAPVQQGGYAQPAPAYPAAPAYQPAPAQKFGGGFNPNDKPPF